MMKTLMMTVTIVRISVHVSASSAEATVLSKVLISWGSVFSSQNEQNSISPTERLWHLDGLNVQNAWGSARYLVNAWFTPDPTYLAIPVLL